MHKKEKAQKTLLEQKLLPLYYHQSAEVSLAILKALFDGGIRMLEYTNRGEAALDNFAVLRKEADKNMPHLLLGIGTIKTKSQARKYINAGADFIVCPSINEEVGKEAYEKNLLWIPGCMTPTEIASAEASGAAIVKLFPGNILGPSYITSIKNIFPGIQFIVTGGVQAEAQNLKNWFTAGAAGVGMGSRLITKEIIENKDYHGLKVATQQALLLVKAASHTAV